MCLVSTGQVLEKMSGCLGLVKRFIDEHRDETWIGPIAQAVLPHRDPIVGKKFEKENVPCRIVDIGWRRGRKVLRQDRPYAGFIQDRRPVPIHCLTSLPPDQAIGVPDEHGREFNKPAGSGPGITRSPVAARGLFRRRSKNFPGAMPDMNFDIIGLEDGGEVTRS